MQRWVTIVVGIAVVALAVWIVTRDFHLPKAVGHDPAAATAALDGGADDGGGLLFALADSGKAAPPELEGLAALEALEHEVRGDAGPGLLLPDGTPVPPLPQNAPRQVRFGVVLVTYAGAQPAPGARPSSRSRADAKALADKLAAAAQQDFHGAVQQGDAGSSDDLGEMRPGILEPAPEYVLFTLAAGGVSAPVDTPRGYWILKRLE